jgi:uncharacterized protein (TIGR02145 family)
MEKKRFLHYRLVFVVLLFIMGVIVLSCDTTPPTGNKNVPQDINIYSLIISGKNCIVSKYPDKPKYAKGDTVGIKAVPNTGYSFFSWSDDASGNSDSIGIIMTGNKYVTAKVLPIVEKDTATIDGRVYSTVKIGTQTWLAENYCGTTGLVNAQNIGYWMVAYSNKTPAYGYLQDSNGTLITKYGLLYNWYGAAHIKVTGWHLPDTVEWRTFCDFCQDNYTGVASALAARTDWNASSEYGSPGYNLLSNNLSGFSGLPTGYRYSTGEVFEVGISSSWWTTVESGTGEAWYFYLYYSISDFSKSMYAEGMGFNVRLIKD